MKTVFLITFLSLTLLQGSANAKPPTEKEFMKKAQKLTYAGRIDDAMELIGEESHLAEPESSGGWDTNSLMLAILWGAVGTGYFIFGRKQNRLVFLLCGVGLCFFPYFVTNLTLNVVMGVGLTVLPFKIR